jgi:hypothetical protein
MLKDNERGTSVIIRRAADGDDLSFRRDGSAAMSDQSRRPAFFWFVLLICGVYTGFCAVTIVANVRHFGTEKDPGWNVRVDATGWIVSDVNASGPAAGRIEPGDRLIARNGDGRVAVLGITGMSDDALRALECVCNLPRD